MLGLCLLLVYPRTNECLLHHMPLNENHVKTMAYGLTLYNAAEKVGLDTYYKQVAPIFESPLVNMHLVTIYKSIEDEVQRDTVFQYIAQLAAEKDMTVSRIERALKVFTTKISKVKDILDPIYSDDQLDTVIYNILQLTKRVGMTPDCFEQMLKTIKTI